MKIGNWKEGWQLHVMQVQLASDADVMQASQGAILTSTCLEDWTEGGVQCGTSEDES